MVHIKSINSLEKIISEVCGKYGNVNERNLNVSNILEEKIDL